MIKSRKLNSTMPHQYHFLHQTDINLERFRSCPFFLNLQLKIIELEVLEGTDKFHVEQPICIEAQ